MKDLGVNKDNFELQDIKKETITPNQLQEMRDLTDSYMSLFSKRSRKYKEFGLKDKTLSEDEIRDYILQEYTFLKRPVFLIDGNIYIGNAAKTVEAVRTAIQ